MSLWATTDHRQAPAFVIREANPLAFELAAEDSILFLDVCDCVLLMTVDPASQSYEEHLPRLDRLHERHYTQAAPVVASTSKPSNCDRLNIWTLRAQRDRCAPRSVQKRCRAGPRAAYKRHIRSRRITAPRSCILMGPGESLISPNRLPAFADGVSTDQSIAEAEGRSSVFVFPLGYT